METGLEIAVIGIAGRFPNAKNIHDFWTNLKNGIESITFFSDEELLEGGIDSRLLENPNYVKAGGMLSDIEYFDAAFFGYTPKEAEIMDPQVRIFHECAWTALEDAGYDPLSYKGLIGLYAGASPNLGWLTRVLLSGKNHDLGNFAAAQLTQKEFLSMRISYKLNLSGPSLFVYTTCSTSLTAIHLGYQALLNGECDIALAGGVTVVRLAKTGYMYEEGMINSPDGYCRAFDVDAKGLVGGDGVGVVVLRRLRDAISGGDHIYAVIIGSAINNDGMQKVGFTAPSIKGQAEVIKMAMQMAGIKPESIGYVETHGTGTKLGDPVEIQGLKLAFNCEKKGFCGIGSVKTNIGHVDCASGAAGFIKTVLAITNRLIPPTLHFYTPSHEIDFINSPFYVNSSLTPWENNGYPLRAGVSAFGQGGTNAHVILEEFKAPAQLGRHALGKGTFNLDDLEGIGYLFILSAKTSSALDKITQNLAQHFRGNPHIHPADASYTLQEGRHAFKYRKMFVSPSIKEAVGILETLGSSRAYTFTVREENRPVIFLFPHEEREEEFQSKYKNLGEKLYRHNLIFREEMDGCLEILKVQPLAWFTLPYALAKMLMRCGIQPYAVIGEGSGETVAQCLSGEVSLESVSKFAASASELKPSHYMALSFSNRLKQLMELENPIFVYFGHPTEKIEKLFAGSRDRDSSGHIVHLFNSSHEQSSNLNYLMTQIGHLWLYGVNIDCAELYSGEQRYRISLPTYPFDSQRYWIDELSNIVVIEEGSNFSKAPLNRQGVKQKISSVSLHPRPELSNQYIPPTNETEKKLVNIWQNYFGFDQIGIKDDFFELGGDSLKVIMLVSMIQKDLNIRVPIPEFFDRPTIKELSEYIRDIPSDKVCVSLEPIEKKEYYELSSAQKRMFIFHKINDESLSYNTPLVLRLNLEIHPEKVAYGFNQLIKRHETLRTSFKMLPDGPVQVVHDDVPFKVEFYEKIEEGNVAKIVSNFIRPFNLGTAPLLRVGLIKINQAKYVLMVDMYHIISDAFSFGVLANDFLAFCDGQDLPPMEIQYKDFCQWQKQLYDSGLMDKQKEFWVGEFEDRNIPQLNIPMDFPRPPVRNIDEGDHLSFELESALREKIYAVLNQTETTLPMIMFAVYFVLLFVYTKQEDIVIGMLSSGRSHKDLGNIIGMFVNTLPMRGFPQENKTFAEFLKEIKRIMLNAYENQDYPFDELIVDLGLQGNSSRNPLFDVVFAYNTFNNKRTKVVKAEKRGNETPGNKMESYESPVKFAKFDLYLQVNEVEDTLDILLRYSTQLFKPSTIGTIKKYYIEILEQVTDNIVIKLKDIVFSHDFLISKSRINNDDNDFNI